jgi:hypothetical protein
MTVFSFEECENGARYISYKEKIHKQKQLTKLLTPTEIMMKSISN